MSIPIKGDQNGVAHPVPKEMLPVQLPENIDLNVKGKPLDHDKKWKEIEINGKKFTRETYLRHFFVLHGII